MEHSSFIQSQRPSLQNLLSEWNVVKDTKVMIQSLTCVRSWRGRVCWTDQSLGTGYTWLLRHVKAESYHDRGTPNSGSISSVSRGKGCSLKTHMENAEWRQKCTEQREYIWHKGPLVFGLLEPISCTFNSMEFWFQKPPKTPNCIDVQDTYKKKRCNICTLSTHVFPCTSSHP